MGLSFTPLKKLAEGVVNQLNPFDNGRTFSNPQGNAPVQQAANQPAPSVFQQATHNGITNVAGDLFKPVLDTVLPATVDPFRSVVAEATGNKAAEAAQDARTYQDAKNSVPGQVLRMGYNAGTVLADVPGAVAGDIRGFQGKAPTPYEAAATAQGAKAFQQTPVAGLVSPAEKALSYVPAIAQNEQQAGYNPKQGFFKSAVIDPGEAALQVAGLKAGVPEEEVAGEAAPKEVAPTEPVKPTITEKVAPTEPVAPAETVAQTAPPEEVAPTPTAPTVTPPPATPILKGSPVAQAIPPAHTSMPDFNAAVDDVAKEYSTPNAFDGDVENVAKQATGAGKVGQRVANVLRKAIKDNLTDEEQEAVSDALEGHPTDKLTGKAFEVFNAIKPLYDQAFSVRQIIKPSINRVSDYLTRLSSNSIGAGFKRVTGAIEAKFNDLASPYSEERTLGKFVSKNDTQYGVPTKLGLVDKDNGRFQDTTGKVYKRVPVTTRELEANGFGPYEHLIRRQAGVYHGDTLSLKAKGEAVKELATNPHAHGLFTQDDVDSGAAPGDARPVTGVAGLKDADKNPIYATPKDATTLNDKLGDIPKKGNLAGRAVDAVENAVAQAIVINPIFHGVNLLYQGAIAAGNLPGKGTGWMRVAAQDITEDDIRQFYREGNHSEDYGANRDNVLSKVTAGTSKLNAKAMAAIEQTIRVKLWKASREAKMSAEDTRINIDKFLGSDKEIDPMIRRVTLFAHFFRTTAHALKEQIIHPVGNLGANVNTAYVAALTAAASYGYQQYTGNPNASVRYPGELGIAKDVIEAGNDVRKGQFGEAAGIAANRINPVPKEVIQQETNKDLFTGQPVDQTPAAGPIPGGRIGHAIQSLVAPSTIVAKGATGKRSAAELAANELGLTTPHAKGYQAAPKQPFLNTKGAIKEKTGDPTGEQQQQAYFNNVAGLKKQFAGNKNETDEITKYLDRDHDPATGATIQNSPASSYQNAIAFSTDPKLLAGVQKFEQSQSSHDPIWDLPADKLSYLMNERALLEGSAEKNTLKANATNSAGDNWITDIENKSNDYYNNLPKIPGEKQPIAQGPKYPVFDASTQALLSAYDNATTDQRTTLIQNNAGELSNAFNQIATWTNQQRKAQAGQNTPALNIYPEASPQVQAILNTYDALPKGNGVNGGSPDRSAWINANPTAYAQMQNYLTQASMQSLVKNAALAQFQGSTASQQLLKDIQNVGQYDIASTPGTNGGPTTYEINPQLAYQQSSSSSSNSYSSPYTAAKDAEKAAKASSYAQPKSYYPKSSNKISLRQSKPIKGYKIKNNKIGTKFKVAEAKPTKRGKISLKSTA